MRPDRCLECNFNANRLENKQHNPDKTWLCSLASVWRGSKSFLGCIPIHRCGREDVTFLSYHIVCGILVWGKAKGYCLASHNRSLIHWTPLVLLFQSARSGHYKNMKHSLIPWAWCVLATVSAFSSSFANGSEILTQTCSATKPLSCWHFNSFIPEGNQLCGCECLIHQMLQASHF